FGDVQWQDGELRRDLEDHRLAVSTDSQALEDTAGDRAEAEAVGPEDRADAEGAQRRERGDVRDHDRFALRRTDVEPLPAHQAIPPLATICLDVSECRQLGGRRRRGRILSATTLEDDGGEDDCGPKMKNGASHTTS